MDDASEANSLQCCDVAYLKQAQILSSSSIKIIAVHTYDSLLVKLSTKSPRSPTISEVCVLSPKLEDVL